MPIKTTLLLHSGYTGRIITKTCLWKVFSEPELRFIIVIYPETVEYDWEHTIEGGLGYSYHILSLSWESWHKKYEFQHEYQSYDKHFHVKYGGNIYVPCITCKIESVTVCHFIIHSYIHAHLSLVYMWHSIHLSIQ